MEKVTDRRVSEKAHAAFYDHVSKYARIDTSDFEAIKEFVDIVSIAKGEQIVKTGTRVNFTYWVWKGLLVSTLNDGEGTGHVIQFAIENCWITDQHAFYNSANATFDITAVEPSVSLRVSFADREALCEKFPVVQEFFRKKANDSFVKQQMRLITYLTADTKRRYELLEKEYPGLCNRVSKKLLAAYLGVSRETLSRL